MKVYLATSGEYSTYRVERVFARKEDAEAYELASDVEEFELAEGPAEVRQWHSIQWDTWIPDRGASDSHAENPNWYSEKRGYDDQPENVMHSWRDHEPRGCRTLYVGGWDLDLVRKVYSEQRAQHIAKRDMGVEES